MVVKGTVIVVMVTDVVTWGVDVSGDVAWL